MTDAPPPKPQPPRGNTAPLAERLRVAHLSPKKATRFDLQPDEPARNAIAQELGLIALPALRLTGEITAHGGDAWQLSADLQAQVVQPCVVTLAPVKTSLREEVLRIYSPHLTAPDEEEAEMPDDALEPLGAFIDLGAVAIEALSLALPLYPRADGATLDSEITGQDTSPPEDTRRPFADLAALMKQSDSSD